MFKSNFFKVVGSNKAYPYLLRLLTAMQTARIKIKVKSDVKIISHSGMSEPKRHV